MSLKFERGHNPEISAASARPALPRNPISISTGTRDIMRPSLERFSMFCADNGLPVDLKIWDGMWHVFEYYPQIPESGQSLEEIAAFLKRHLGA